MTSTSSTRSSPTHPLLTVAFIEVVGEEATTQVQEVELSSDADHATTISALAAKIGLDDPTRIQLFTVPPCSSLATMLGRTTRRPSDSYVLYYKILDALDTSSLHSRLPPVATAEASDPSSPLPMPNGAAYRGVCL